MVSLPAQPEAPPLREDDTGAVRVGQSRVLLEIVIRAFQDGATPEEIVQRYPTLTLSDVYAVIAYYLRHSDEVDSYLSRREEHAVAVQLRVSRQQPGLNGIRQRLLARREG